MPGKCSSRRGGSGTGLISVGPSASSMPPESVGQWVRATRRGCEPSAACMNGRRQVSKPNLSAANDF